MRQLNHDFKEVLGRYPKERSYGTRKGRAYALDEMGTALTFRWARWLTTRLQHDLRTRYARRRGNCRSMRVRRLRQLVRRQAAGRPSLRSFAIALLRGNLKGKHVE